MAAMVLVAIGNILCIHDRVQEDLRWNDAHVCSNSHFHYYIPTDTHFVISLNPILAFFQDYIT